MENESIKNVIEFFMKVSIIGYGKMGKIRANAIEICGGEVIGVF